MPIAEARQRLTKEYKSLQKSPTPYITARPNEANILEWHYIIDGPPDTPYYNGQYHGTITFTSSYPYAPPSVRMYTPSGRFQPRARLCLSLSDFHPESWNPGWSVSTILVGLLSFMTGDEITTGSITTSHATKIQCAKRSLDFNITSNPEFVKIFPEYVELNRQAMPQRLIEIEEADLKNSSKRMALKPVAAATVQTRPGTKEGADAPSGEDEIRQRKLSAAKKEASASGSNLWKFAAIPVLILVIGILYVK